MVSEMVQSAAADEVFHALSNPTRRKVLERLSVGPATVSELAAPFDMQLPSFVQHLSVLQQSRLVRSKKRGRVRTYEIAPERFKVVEDWLTARRQLWEARLDRFDQYVKQLKENESETRFRDRTVHRRSHAARLGSVDQTGASQGVVHAQGLGSCGASRNGRT